MFVLPALGAGARGRMRLGVSLSRHDSALRHIGNSGGAGDVPVEDELPMDKAICAGTMGLPAMLSGGRLEGS